MGELSLGKVEIPLPDPTGPSKRLLLHQPLRVELHWKAYQPAVSPDASSWEEEPEPAFAPPSPAWWAQGGGGYDGWGGGGGGGWAA